MGMEDVRIRPVRLSDAPDLNELRRAPGTMEMILALPSERTSTEFIEGLTRDDHLFVAEVEADGRPKVVGVIGLHVSPITRKRHSARLGISVHPGWQNRGIGRALMRSALDLADNWLMLVRVELEVFTDNARAIGLYRSLGFLIEGTKRCAAARSGELADEYLMARIRPSFRVREAGPGDAAAGALRPPDGGVGP